MSKWGDPENAVYEQGHRDGESCNQANWDFALSEVANLPDDVASLGPYEFADWLNEHWTDRPDFEEPNV